ncbi:SDR family oxidoreductase [Flavobacterium sp. D11R37]|uniref:SDR family oxidoreductase n=1 Tax=Flavobacterium coralii TaxID=2838017 RepID=UPI001CA6F1F6|nr:SDR family oxidoreductase [Flavobacterium coralii]MBY8963460.1 SDR family oxidoreductase [Flavobacterium coralii]
MENIQEYLPQQVQGKKVLISGGTTGIGRATAVLLAKLGATVAVFGRHEQELNDALRDIEEQAGVTVIGFTADTAKEEDIKKIFDTVKEELGGLDVLINNAAIGFGSVTDGGYKDWEYAVKTNLLGYLACAGEAIKIMKDNGGGHIVNIGSMSADVREEKSAVYVATKSGIQGFSEALRKQVNPDGIKISLIEPGAVDTDMQQQDTEKKREEVASGKMLKADDIAMAVLYCISQPKRCDVVELKVRPHLQLI